jgi:hypothetical protein
VSVYQRFPTTAAALVAFALGECRRHVEIDGHVIDLVQAVAEQGRAEVEPDPLPESGADLSAEARAVWDATVAANVRNALTGHYLGDPADEADRVARAKPGPICPYCLRAEAAP